MTAIRQKFSSQADPDLLIELGAIAQEEGRQFQAVLEQALREFVERKRSATPTSDGAFPGERGEKPPLG